ASVDVKPPVEPLYAAIAAEQKISSQTRDNGCPSSKSPQQALGGPPVATTSRSLTPCRSSFSKAMKAAAAAASVFSRAPDRDRPDSERTLGRRTPSGPGRDAGPKALSGWLLGNLKETRNTRSSNSARSAALDDATVAVASLTTLTAQLDVPAADGRSSMIDARTTGLAPAAGSLERSVALLVLAVTFAAVACCLVQQVEARPRAAVAELLQSAIWQEEALSFSLTCCEDPRDGQAETDSAYRIMNGSDVD
uniref:Transmembrane protein n=1 Tax=Macrostomum lignano TaxID=282301 RepID=A0A1I8FGE2_9PLAT